MQAIVRRWDVEVLQARDEEVLPALDAAPRRQHYLDVVRSISFADVHKPSVCGGDDEPSVWLVQRPNRSCAASRRDCRPEFDED